MPRVRVREWLAWLQLNQWLRILGWTRVLVADVDPVKRTVMAGLGFETIDAAADTVAQALLHPVRRAGADHAAGAVDRRAGTRPEVTPT